MKRTKIVCTIGPASESRSTIEKMVRAGMNAARLNLSHGNVKHHRFLIRNIRAISRKLQVPVSIIIDLQGPKIRTGKIPGRGIEVKEDEKVILIPEKQTYELDPGDAKLIPIQFPSLARSVRKGMTILIDDGLIVLKIKQVRGKHIVCKVAVPGTITSLRGMNVPGASILGPVITAKDREDIAWSKREGVDYFALSFVKSAKDVHQLRKLVSSKKDYQSPKIISKIENIDAVNRIDEIIAASDAIMIARGDLGLELPPQMVPMIQKQIIGKCLHASRSVIVATQMLESMIQNVRPTRAEVSDVATAVVDHTDAVMLSAETAFGRYPIESVKMMHRIIRETEVSPYDDLPHGFLGDQDENNEKAVAHAVHELSKNTNARVILIATTSGFSARLISRQRPQNAHIVGLTNREKIFQQLALLWGVEPFLLKSVTDVEKLITLCIRFILEKKIAQRGDRVIIVTGQPIGSPGTMNLIKVQVI